MKRAALLLSVLAIAWPTLALAQLSPAQCDDLRRRWVSIDFGRPFGQPLTPTEHLLRYEMERDLRTCPARTAPPVKGKAPAAECRTVIEGGAETTICGNR